MGTIAIPAAITTAAAAATVLASGCAAQDGSAGEPEPEPEPEPESHNTPGSGHMRATLCSLTAQQQQDVDCLPLYPGQDLAGAALRVRALQHELAAYQLGTDGTPSTQPSSLPVLARGRNWPGHYFQVDEFILWKGAVAALHSAVISTKERLEGNCLCSLKNTSKQATTRAAQLATVSVSSDFVLFGHSSSKRKAVRQNLFKLAELGLADRILEVGFNAGHSAALFCYGWDMRELRLARGRERHEAPIAERALPTKVACLYTGFDLCEHKYAQLCFEALRSVYGGSRQMEFVPPPLAHCPGHGLKNIEMALIYGTILLLVSTS